MINCVLDDTRFPFNDFFFVVTFLHNKQTQYSDQEFSGLDVSIEPIFKIVTSNIVYYDS